MIYFRFFWKCIYRVKSKALALFIFLISTLNFAQYSEKFNVLLIIADDLNCAIGAYGDPLAETPNIDRLAQEGVMFTNAHVQYPLCGPSRVSFMTGLYPDQTKSKELRLHVRQTIPDVITLGQKFRMENYHSVRVGKVYHYHNPRDIGTASYDDPFTWDRTVNPYGRDKIEEHKISFLKPRFNGGVLSWYKASGKDEEQTDGIGATNTIAFLDEFAKSGENFFLAFGLYRPHVPFVATEKYYELQKNKDFSVQESSSQYLETIPEPAAISVRMKKEQVGLDTELAQEIRQAYYATVSFVDAQIGRVLDKLKKTGLDKKTIVVFTSDHGYHLGEHGHWQKQTLFEHATRVPLIFSGPGILSGLNPIHDPVELVDLYPTIMELLQMETPNFVRGKSLNPYFKGSKIPIRNSALTELLVKTPKGMAQGYSIKTKRYRLNRWHHKNLFKYELYDHKYDQDELNNLAGHQQYTKVLDSLKKVLEKRVVEAQEYPQGLGRQLDKVQPWFEPKINLFKRKFSKTN
jgi:arylsulfatase A-like enzyme